MKRRLSEIEPIKTSHDVGEKRVLIAANESGCSLTQIAVTDLRAGEVASAHIHPDMQEGFYVLSGELELTLDGKVQRCVPEDFIYVNSGTSHEMRAISDVRIMTIGCVIEAMREKLYPMLFEPNLHSVVWGGNRITRWKSASLCSNICPDSGSQYEHKPQASESTSCRDTMSVNDNSEAKIGESWEVSAVDGSPSIIANGTWAGYSLPDVIARRPKEILGKAVAEKYGNVLPLLAKFIDAHDNLSIQVHPDDTMAKRMHNKLGKSEMWYIIDAKPGACLYAGFKESLTPEEYKRKVEDGTIVESLAKHEVRPGDVFYLPSGRVHAIGAGILLAEIQQSSDITYRIFDYNRLGMNGMPRELHTELAAKALDFEVYDEYRTPTRGSLEETAHSLVDRILDTPFFSVRIIDTDVPKHRNLIKYDSFILIMCIQGECQVKTRATKSDVLLREGSSCLIPAAIADYDIIPTKQNDAKKSVRVLEAYIDNKKRSFLKNLVTGFQHFKM